MLQKNKNNVEIHETPSLIQETTILIPIEKVNSFDYYYYFRRIKKYLIFKLSVVKF